jgi:hypothetical protein
MVHNHTFPQPGISTEAYTVGAAPLALGSLLQLWVQADQVVSPWTGVTQDNFPSLLAHLAVILVVCLVAITIVNWGGWRGSDWGRSMSSQSVHKHLYHPRPEWMLDRWMDGWMGGWVGWIDG